MKMSLRGLATLAKSEGIVTSRYRDSVGVWTIGIGHTAAAGPPDPAKILGTISVKTALALFKRDIARYEEAVNRAIKVPLEQHEFDALVHFHYNTGAIKRATLTKSINAGNKLAGGRQIMNWLRPKEIRKRRQLEQSMFLYGVYEDGMASVYPARGGKVLWSSGYRINVMALLEKMA